MLFCYKKETFFVIFLNCLSFFAALIKPLSFITEKINFTQHASKKTHQQTKKPTEETEIFLLRHNTLVTSPTDPPRQRGVLQPSPAGGRHRAELAFNRRQGEMAAIFGELREQVYKGGEPDYDVTNRSSVPAVSRVRSSYNKSKSIKLLELVTPLLIFAYLQVVAHDTQ